MNNDQQQETLFTENKKQTSHIPTTIGLGLVVLGIVILVGEIFDFGIGRYIWPFFIFIQARY